MTPLYQTIIGLVALLAISGLAALRIVNPDAAIAVISTILGYVFGVGVPSPLQRLARVEAPTE